MKSSSFVVGDEGPVLLVSARLAWRILPAFDRLAGEAVRNGQVLDTELADLMAALRRLSSAYAAARVAASSGSGTSLAKRAEQQRRITPMSASEAAAVLGCTPRNVRALANRGALPGSRGPSGWTFDRATVEAYEERRHGRPAHAC